MIVEHLLVSGLVEFARLGEYDCSLSQIRKVLSSYHSLILKARNNDVLILIRL